MRFTQTLTVAVTTAYLVEASSLGILLQVPDASFSKDISFWKKTFLSMQRDSSNTVTDCQNAYAEMIEMYDLLQPRLSGPNAYQIYSDGLQQKGQGSGTALGKMIEDVQMYIELLTSATVVYNECRVKFYTQAISKVGSGLPGLIDQMVNLFFRSQDTEIFDALATAIANDDEDAAAEALGTILTLIFNVEVPEVYMPSFYQNTDAPQV